MLGVKQAGGGNPGGYVKFTLNWVGPLWLDHLSGWGGFADPFAAGTCAARGDLRRPLARTVGFRCHLEL